MSTKKSLTYREYLSTIGLLEIAKRYNRELKRIEGMLIEITGELDSDGEPLREWAGGHCGDQCYSLEPSIDELVQKIGLKIQKPVKRPRREK